MLRTDYFRYVLAPGDLIKGAFPFQRANKTCSAEDLSEWDGSSGITQAQQAFLIQGDKYKDGSKAWMNTGSTQTVLIRQLCKPGNLLRKGGKQINVLSPNSCRFSNTDLFQGRQLPSWERRVWLPLQVGLHRWFS